MNSNTSTLAAVPPQPPAPIFERLLTDVGRQRLTTGVTVYLETFCDSDRYHGPAWAARLLDQGFIDLVEMASHACAVHNWNMVELQRGPSAWDSDESKVDVSVRHWGLQVSSDGLWFNGRPKDGNETVQSRELPLAELVAALNASDEPYIATLPENFRWYGGAIFYGLNDLDYLCEIVGDAVPELLAKETELEMRRHIESRERNATTDDARAPAMPAPARRNRMV